MLNTPVTGDGFQCQGVRVDSYPLRAGVDFGTKGLPSPAGRWTEVVIHVINKDVVTREFIPQDQVLNTSSVPVHPDPKGMKLYDNNPQIWAGDSQDYTLPFEVPWGANPQSVEIHCGKTVSTVGIK
ncbi:hypothetical protein [Mycobacteroides franklinii]|uniref:hypothetical protein n=1 Tax=Mycobacteroides franklinii TaxID=948102 RepID=UPI0012FFD086|nr:hypothetical protein [Mycobacteroides franklinii]